MSKVSMAGLDLSFMKSAESQKALEVMRRKAKKPKAARPKRSNLFPGAFVLPDLDRAYGGEWQSPVDGTWISSRSQLREHNLRNDVIQNGDVRGEKVREIMRDYMKYDPSVIGKSEAFSWTDPNR